jgi:spermidine synthase
MTTLAQNNEYIRKINGSSLKNSKLKIIQNNALLPSDRTILEIENQNKLIETHYEEVAEVNIINLDASKFVEQISGLYDIIIIDFPDPNSPDLSKLYSLKFYSHLEKKLSAFGFLVQQSTSPVHAKEVFLAIGRTMQAAGFSCVPYHDNVPSFGEWGWWIAGKAEKYNSSQILDKLKAVETIPVKTKYLTSKLINSSLHFGKDQLNSNYSDINTITNSLVSKLYLQAWQK